MNRSFRAQEVVVYEKRKHGTHPSPRAHHVRPAPLGDDYDYVVNKYWIVVQASKDGHLVVRTPGGKVHEIDSSDPCLRRPTWLERMWLKLRGRERLRALRQPSL